MARGEGGRWFTLREVAAQLGVDFGTVKGWATGGTLRAVRLPNGYFRVEAGEIERMRRELEKDA